MSYPYIKGVRGPEDLLKKDIQLTNCNSIDVYFNEKAISEMEIMLAPNFNADLVEQFLSRLKNLGFTKELLHSKLEVKI